MGRSPAVVDWSFVTQGWPTAQAGPRRCTIHRYRSGRVWGQDLGHPCAVGASQGQRFQLHAGGTGQPKAVEARASAPGVCSRTRPARAREASDVPPR